jgi:hypothetical protein
MGKPPVVSVSSLGKTNFHYVHIFTRRDASVIIPIIGSWFGTGKSFPNELKVCFDTNGVVCEVINTSGSLDCGYNLAADGDRHPGWKTNNSPGSVSGQGKLGR